jgi:hypothetical protein
VLAADERVQEILRLGKRELELGRVEAEKWHEKDLLGFRAEHRGTEVRKKRIREETTLARTLLKRREELGSHLRRQELARGD